MLVDEVVFLLRPRDEGWVIDATVGMGGHAEAILSASGRTVRLLGLDTDAAALAQARERLAPFGDRVDLAHSSFGRLEGAAAARGVDRARAILLDLGMSSWQLEQSGRGFSFQADEPLDMRLDPSRGDTAAALLNRLPEPELARIIFEYGEEPHARRIARAIVHRRPLTRTGDLVAAVRGAVPRAAWPRRLHVATRSFQAVRMA
ncbi:MAG: 16S rRNA (cytosine(1402)-N(4))-methyltransferase RsmH, partial [Candidatus Rokuibacteriota bacterium]